MASSGWENRLIVRVRLMDNDSQLSTNAQEWTDERHFNASKTQVCRHGHEVCRPEKTRNGQVCRSGRIVSFKVKHLHSHDNLDPPTSFAMTSPSNSEQWLKLWPTTPLVCSNPLFGGDLRDCATPSSFW